MIDLECHVVGRIILVTQIFLNDVVFIQYIKFTISYPAVNCFNLRPLVYP